MLGPLTRATAASLITAALVTGCRGSDTPSPSAAAPSTLSSTSSPSTAVTPTTTAAPGTTRPPTEEERVVDAYRQLWVEIVAANNPPNPDSPGLQEVASGEMLTKARDSAQQNKATGTGLRFATPSDFSISIESVNVTNDEAAIVLCLTDDIQQFRLNDGSLVNGNKSTHRVNAALRREQGTWKTYKNDYPQEEGAPQPCVPS